MAFQSFHRKHLRMFANMRLRHVLDDLLDANASCECTCTNDDVPIKALNTFALRARIDNERESKFFSCGGETEKVKRSELGLGKCPPDR